MRLRKSRDFVLFTFSLLQYEFPKKQFNHRKIITLSFFLWNPRFSEIPGKLWISGILQYNCYTLKPPKHLALGTKA
jgi:hypothetical protein